LMLRLATASLMFVGSFAFWHSGARANSLCEHERFVSAGPMSIWPPGTRCTFGEPATTDTLLNPWFVWTLLVVLVVAFALGELLERAMAARAARRSRLAG
jgi:hypothetical protein